MQLEDYCRLLESDDLTLPCPIDNRHLQVALWSYWPQSAPSRSEIDETTGLIHAPPHGAFTERATQKLNYFSKFIYHLFCSTFESF